MVAGERSRSPISGAMLLRMITVLALFIVIYMGFTIAGNATRNRELQAQTAQLNQQISADKVEYQRLDALRRYMRTNEFIEAEARQEGLVMPGDTVITVNAPAAAATPPSNVSASWWERYFTP